MGGVLNVIGGGRRKMREWDELWLMVISDGSDDGGKMMLLFDGGS